MVIVKIPVDGSYDVPVDGPNVPDPPDTMLIALDAAVMKLCCPVNVLVFPVNWLAISSIKSTLLVLDSL